MAKKREGWIEEGYRLALIVGSMHAQRKFPKGEDGRSRSMSIAVMAGDAMRRCGVSVEGAAEAFGAVLGLWDNPILPDKSAEPSVRKEMGAAVRGKRRA